MLGNGGTPIVGTIRALSGTGESYLTVGLGEPHEGAHYKSVAVVIEI